jgi:hypothetical protein
MFLKISVGEYVFKAVLHRDRAPVTCERLLAAIPITGRVIQARWSGEAVWLQMNPYGVEAPLENQTSHPGRGELLYYPGGVSEKEILIPYGSACFSSKVGMLPGSHFATIVEGADRLAEMGEKVLWEGAKPIRIELDERDAT